MKTLKETVEEFRSSGRALGHFNISDSNQLKALAAASRETGLPVVVGLSEGEREYFPLSHTRALIDCYTAEGVPLYLNADHTYTLENAKRAIDAGVDSIVVDGAKLPRQENVELVSGVVAYARASGREVLVEGELGYIGQSSQVIDALPEGAAATEELMTKPEDLAAFVKETGADMMAPAVGNIHGMVKGGNPKLSIARIKDIAATAGVPLVLHGGSGASNEEFREAIQAGISMIHINTELRVLYRTSLEKSLADNPEQTTPYKFLTPAVDAMTSFLAEHMRLFSGQ